MLFSPAPLVWQVVWVGADGRGLGACGHLHGSADEATRCPFEPAALPDVCAGSVREVRDPAYRTAAAQSWGRSDETDQDPVVWVRLGHRRRLAAVFRDFPMLTYRIDLLLAQVHGPLMLAIECDGHEFHDRTKQQAAYDRARDRELLLKGVTTIRFTGSEIFHSPERCATQAIEVFTALMERALETERAAAWCG